MPGPGAYLDYAATTPMRPAAIAAMEPFLAGTFGNPSGSHAAARAAKTALEEAREHIAAALGACPAEIVLTGGGSLLKNIDVLLREETGLPVMVCDDPISAVVLGSGKALDHLELLKEVTIS